ncbi:hypothetical protein OHB44_09915 [Micromonospora sp. NBC_00821]|uniref:hypothetical protein n=1 Tax=Micromonospora sp. NBC_00821 TaxID=2975977 RepID=UPI002ED1EEE8|nr:hypothetical protein OHB44_09915 [Micromonospora sp. NBC_00821]
MRVVTSALLFVFTVVIGIAINKVTDTFTWAWAGALATLVLGGVAVQITATRLQDGATDSAVGAEATAQQTMTITGGIVVGPVQTVVVGVSGRSLAVMATSMAVVAAITFSLALLAVTVNRRADETRGAGRGPSASKGAETGIPRLAGPDPYLYVGLDDSIHLARKQACPGLFGLCLGQPVQLALDSFGITEIEGFPQSEGRPGATCHRWHPKHLDTVTVCDVGGAIESIRYDSLSRTSLALAAPEGVVVEFPAAIPTQAPLITTAFQDKPFLSTYVPGEGEGIFGINWFLPQESEGTPDAYLAIVARAPGLFEIDARPCIGEDDVYYPYDEILQNGEMAIITSVEVNMFQPGDIRGPAACK